MVNERSFEAAQLDYVIQLLHTFPVLALDLAATSTVILPAATPRQAAANRAPFHCPSKPTTTDDNCLVPGSAMPPVPYSFTLL